MQDNELYNYFRERKHTAEEMPQDALWTKIDAGLNAVPTAATASISAIKAIIIAAAGITITTAALITLNRNETKAPVKYDETTTLPREHIHDKTTERVQLQDTVKPKRVKAADEKKKNSKKFTALPFRVYQKNGALNVKDSIKTSNVIIKNYGSTIKISTKEKLTKIQFDSLVTKALQTYKDEKGKILVVNAIGFTPFRKLIEYKTLIDSNLNDSLLIKQEDFKFIIPKDSLSKIIIPAYYKTDTIQKNKKKRKSPDKN